MNPTPTDLLAWAMANKANDSTEHNQVNVNNIDPKWIEVILGKPDSARMKDLVASIQESSDLNLRIASFDELELLLESLDNANDLQPLNLWKPLIELLGDKESEIRMHTSWVMGTAVQNNLKSQADFERNGGLKAMLDLATIEQDPKVINKILYCLSSAVRANPDNLAKFLQLNGLTTISKILLNGNEEMGRRVIFFVSALVVESSIDLCIILVEQLEKSDFKSILVGYLENASDEQLIEQSLILLSSLIDRSIVIVSPIELKPILTNLQSKTSPELKANISELIKSLD